MSEHIGGNDIVPSQPPNGEGGDKDRLGYPPPGYEAGKQARAGKEAASRAEENPDAVLAALEAGKETPDQRQVRLGKFVEKHFEDACPPEHRNLATAECIAFEDRFRVVWEEPDLQLEDADAGDPELKKAITEKVRLTIEHSENAKAIAAKTETKDAKAAAVDANDRETIPASEANLARAKDENADLTASKITEDVGVASDRQENAEVNRDLTSVADLQKNFEAIKAANNGSTIAALKSLLHPEAGVNSPEMKALVQNAVATAEALITAIPGKEAATEKLLNQTGLNLFGGSQMEVFSGLFAAAEASEDFSDEDVKKLRAVVSGSDEAIKTGSAYDKAMNETVVDKDGNEVPAHTEDSALDYGLGVKGFTSDNGDQQFMRATPEHGHGITIDVTNMSPASKGIAASYLGMWKTAEDAGETDFFLDVVQYDIRGQSVLDEASLFKAARLMNYTFGGQAGYNGEIVHGDDAKGMMQWQAQLRSPKGDAGRSDTNRSDTRSNLQALAIMDTEGNIDEDVLKAFGDYSRDNWFGAPEYEDVQTHLRKLFPAKFREIPPVAGTG